VEFTNTSNKTIEAMRIKLKQVWECNEIFHHKDVVIKHDIKEGFPAGRGTQIRDINFVVPPYLMAVPTITNATMFKCSYYVGIYLVIKMGGLVSSERVKCHVPIIISSLPRGVGDNVAPLPRTPSGTVQNAHALNPDSANSGFNNEMNQFIANFQEMLNTEEQERRSRIVRDNSAPNLPALLNAPAAALTLPRTNSHPAVSEYNPFTNPHPESPPQSSKDKVEEHDTHHHSDEEKSENPASECVICYDGPKNMLLLPCAHIATCVTCTAQIMRTSKTCPVCRAKITQVLRTYQV